MNILFIRPKARFKTHCLPPMGILYLSAYLKKNLNCSSHIIDFQIDKDEPIVKSINQYNPSCICMTSSTMEYPHALKLATSLKKQFPQKTIIIGGAHVSCVKDEILNQTPFDFGIIGEGEIPLLQLLKALQQKKQYDNIPGLIYRDTETIKSNPQVSLVQTLDDLPYPDWDLITISDYKNSMALLNESQSFPIVTSRGCPHRCIFCHNNHGQKTRLHSPDRTLNEIAILTTKYGVREFDIIDDIFNINKQRAISIMEGIIKNNYDIKIFFSNGLRIDLLDSKLLTLFRQAGVQSISFPIETASKESQKYIQKEVDLKKAQEMIATAAKLGIFCVGYFIVGIPQESSVGFKKTITFILNSKLHVYKFFNLQFFKGTDLYHKSKDNPDYISQAKKLSSFHYESNHFINLTAMDNQTIFNLQKKIARRFYCNPSRLIAFFKTYPGKKKLLTNVLNSQGLKRLWRELHPSLSLSSKQR